MGKRKRVSDHNQIEPSSDTMPCSLGMELLSEEKRLNAIDSSELKPLSSVLDIADSSTKLQNVHHPSTANQHQSLGHSIFLKRSRHHYAHQYSRRGLANLANASTSRGKGTSLRDDKLSFKFATQCNSVLGRHSEYKDKAFFRPERIRSSNSLTRDTVSTDLLKLVCEICQKALIRKICIPDMPFATVDLLEVAVLACGHSFHAECLDLKTNFEDKRDPPCPSCMGLLSQIDDDEEEED
ncbi:hypothetical protein L484_024924 [Morus notabilis]|uniref:RING-type domain-containing protein n=1 Tax=Morus notabilis TaxID=981085 RepID=W9RRT3_9ROSA|nr:uncharacterized protein LOC21407644 [Morus notabilis]EXB66628.1 hypothetical protein L484_024924 [Morus notabilis]